MHDVNVKYVIKCHGLIAQMNRLGKQYGSVCGMSLHHWSQCSRTQRRYISYYYVSFFVPVLHLVLFEHLHFLQNHTILSRVRTGVAISTNFFDFLELFPNWSINSEDFKLICTMTAILDPDF